MKLSNKQNVLYLFNYQTMIFPSRLWTPIGHCVYGSCKFLNICSLHYIDFAMNSIERFRLFTDSGFYAQPPLTAVAVSVVQSEADETQFAADENIIYTCFWKIHCSKPLTECFCSVAGKCCTFLHDFLCKREFLVASVLEQNRNMLAISVEHVHGRSFSLRNSMARPLT